MADELTPSAPLTPQKDLIYEAALSASRIRTMAFWLSAPSALLPFLGSGVSWIVLLAELLILFVIPFRSFRWWSRYSKFHRDDPRMSGARRMILYALFLWIPSAVIVLAVVVHLGPENRSSSPPTATGDHAGPPVERSTPAVDSLGASAVASPEKIVDRSEGDFPKWGDSVYVEEPPKVLHKVQPEYPDAARSMGISGKVVIRALVGRDGRVKQAAVLESVPTLDEPALVAVRQWTFRPAIAEGKPVAVWVEIPVQFHLE